jgi:NADH:ubiquinone oxidoreductase subunit 4 (subunit M)
MLARFRRLMDFELSLAELIGVGLMLAGPYLIVGLVWASTHTGSFQRMGGVELLVAMLGSIVLWPALLLANVCLT